MPLANVEARTTRIDCPNCAKTAEAEIQKLAGVAGARIDLLNAKVFYAFDTEKTDGETLRAKIEGLGHFKFVADGAAKNSDALLSRSVGWSLAGAVTLYIVGAILHFGLQQELAGTVSFYLATIVGGWDILRRAIVGVRHKRLDINVLMSIAIFGAIIIGDLHEAVVVVVLFGLANLLESYSLWRLSKTLGSLEGVSSEQALLRRGNDIVAVPPSALVKGDRIVLKEGMRIPADGVVVAGSSSIDMASLTGESQPRPVTVGSQAFAGSLNLDGYLEVEVTAPADDSRMAKILKMIGEASARKARVERFVDRFAKIYTPIVVALAVVVAVAPPLFFDASFSDWIYKALVFLVISCPCALVISTPVAVTTALAAASKMQAAFKGGDALERLAGIRTIAFDKTGTLTTGELALVEIRNSSSLDESTLTQIAASLEQISLHPIARALSAASHDRGLGSLDVDQPKSIPGIGVEGTINNKHYLIAASSTSGLNSGHVVDLVENNCVIATFTFSDQLRSETRRVIEDLRTNGISKIGMLSGDSQHNAERLAKGLGLDFVRGDLLPDQKYKELSSLGDGVAMVGDGINDVVALSGSDVSIAISRFGNDIPAQHSDVILFGNNLDALPKLVRLGRRTLSTIKANITFAFAVKIIFLGLAAAGYANIWMAVVADMGASLIVISNSMRLLR